MTYPAAAMGTALVDVVNKLWLSGVGDGPQRHLHSPGRPPLDAHGQLRVGAQNVEARRRSVDRRSVSK